MKSLSDLETSVAAIFSTEWTRRNGQDVPKAADVQLENHGVDLDATILYADLVESTGLVRGHKDWFAGEVYKAFLFCACELIKNNDGVITAFDGDRVMAVFLGDSKNSSAAKCALQINYSVLKIINPAIKNQYADTTYQLKQAVGIDTGKVLVARTGVRGDNDLVWVGRSANYAAKLCSVRESGYYSFITADVFSRLSEETKMGGDPKRSMWDKFIWTETGEVAYKSSWHWKPD
jgi:class 3 adenylate cyclase